MKPLLIVISISGLILAIPACRHSAAGTLDYNRLIYDSNRIVIFKWDTTNYRFPNNSDPLPLTQQDLSVTDSLLENAIDSFNTNISPALYSAFDSKVPIDSFIINREKYRYQYFPFKDVNGQRVMAVIGFSTDFKFWKHKVYQPRLHYGMRMIELKINLTEKKSDNLHTADFG